ncbi:MAG TPA: amidohydrolase family protein [Propionicimonas sp.]|uniref:amidohydrolase family protein n=1 Tax=Propionicimonas sp. TaxID=1955623 RepID=UPI002F3FA7FC
MTGVQFENAQVLGVDGRFRPGSVILKEGVFGGDEDAAAVVERFDATGLWLTPGFVDVHTHLAWRAFDAADRDGLSPVEQARGVRLNAGRTLAAGVTGIRDAGGLSAALAQEAGGLRAALSVEMLGASDARGPAHLRGRVQQLADAGAAWIKVVATGGVGAGDGVLVPVFDELELKAIHVTAARLNLPVMVHAWGGAALTRSLEFGAASIEHAVLITDEQCRLAADAGAVVVPTVWIYNDVLAMIEAGTLPAVLAPAARRAVEAHPVAVRRCLDAGVRLAMGTDAGLDTQHGRNLHELAALIEAGVPSEAALLAGTAGGARLLGRRDLGVIRPGAPADLVCFTADPGRPEVLRDPSRVAAVYVRGRLLHQATG